MNEIISKVTPLTRGIIWFPQGDLDPTTSSYKALDYLLDGLLTAGETSTNGQSRVIISRNFYRPLYVFIVKELVREEYESFLQLLKKDLNESNNVLVIDEAESFPALQKLTPPEIKSHLQQLK